MSDYPPQLRRGTILPDFELFTQGSSRPISLWDYKQKRNVVLAVLHAGCSKCSEYVEMLQQSERLFGSSNAVTLVVFPGSLTELPAAPATPQILFLADPEDTIRKKLTIQPNEVAIFIADQWGEVYAEHIAADAVELPGAQAIHEWLTLIEIQCPECFPPERLPAG
jgi:peroxiredoxin